MVVQVLELIEACIVSPFNTACIHPRPHSPALPELRAPAPSDPSSAAWPAGQTPPCCSHSGPRRQSRSRRRPAPQSARIRKAGRRGRGPANELVPCGRGGGHVKGWAGYGGDAVSSVCRQCRIWREPPRSCLNCRHEPPSPAAVVGWRPPHSHSTQQCLRYPSARVWTGSWAPARHTKSALPPFVPSTLHPTCGTKALMLYRVLGASASARGSRSRMRGCQLCCCSRLQVGSSLQQQHSVVARGWVGGVGWVQGRVAAGAGGPADAGAAHTLPFQSGRLSLPLQPPHHAPSLRHAHLSR